MSGFQAPITIHQAIDRINRNEFLLPAFQREFVWKSGQIEKLFDSLMKGYPISSMLFWKVKGDTKTEFRFYRFLNKYVEHHQTHNAVFSTSNTNDFHAILDGQQRLTALYVGLCGSYAYKEYKKHSTYSEANYPTRHLYLNISSQYAEDESDMLYKFCFLDKAESREKELYVDKQGESWFKVGWILSLRKDDALDEFLEEFIPDKEARKVIRRLDKIIHNENIINYYEEDEQNPDKAVNVFVRINSGGTYLSFSDILMSITIANWKKDARTEIHSLVDIINRKGFNINKDFILKAFLYLYHKDVKFQITNFKNEFINVIEGNWEKIREAVIALFDLIKTFGLNGYTLTTNNATLPILYYLYHKNIYDQFSTKTAYTDDRLIIRRWLYTILVRRTFGGQSDSVLSQARRAFTVRIEEIKIVDLAQFPAAAINKEIKKIIDIGDDYIEDLLLTQKDTQYSFPILALLYPHLDYKNNNFHQDHLHPAASYNLLSAEDKRKYGWDVYNSILNLQMLDANENMSKNASDLAPWINVQLNRQDSLQFFQNKLMPADVSYDLNAFGEFIEKRKKLLKNKLKAILN